MSEVFDPTRLASKFAWTKAQRPQPWRPRPGDIIVGYYGGLMSRDGAFGAYKAAIVHIPEGPCYSITGITLLQAIEASAVELRAAVRVTFVGRRNTPNGSVKLFDLEYASGPAIEELERQCEAAGAMNAARAAH